jgi:hypothetical protein
MQAYRALVVDLFAPLRGRLADLRRRSGLDIREDLIANLRDPAAIREHLGRLQRIAQFDPPLAIGTAKELVESTAKTVLLEMGEPVNDREDLPALVSRAQRALGVRLWRPGEDRMRIIRRFAPSAPRARLAPRNTGIHAGGRRPLAPAP